MESEFVPIDGEQFFEFACGPQVACFNRCCRDLNQFLYPYDVLRLCRHLEWPSGRFLDRCTRIYDGPRTGLPVVSLRFDPARDLACPFVNPGGCQVYPDRPAACRLYPLARAVTRCRRTGRVTEHFALLREPHCQGHTAPVRRSAAAWLQDQELADYHRMNDPLLDLIALKRRRQPGPLSPAVRRRVQMALYDPDGFRRHVLARPQGDPLVPTPDERRHLADNDEALLRFAYRWVVALIEALPCPAGAAGPPVARGDR